MQRDATGGHKVNDLDPSWPLCMLCHDTGLSDKRGSWEYCGCPAGGKLRDADPQAAARANETAQRLFQNCRAQKGK